MANQKQPTADDKAVAAMMAAVRAPGRGNTVALAWGLVALAIVGSLFTTWWWFAIGFGFGTMPASFGKDLFAACGHVAAGASLCFVPGALILAVVSHLKQLRRRVLCVAALLITMPPAVMISILIALT